MARFIAASLILAGLMGCTPAPLPDIPPGTPSGQPIRTASATSPALSPSPLPSGTTITPAVDTAPKAVRIEGAQGLEIAGTFYPATPIPFPAVLLLHMYGRQRSDWESFAGQLAASGISSLAIDLRGHGETGGAEDWELAQQDCARALAWLVAQPQVDPKRLGVVGASIGANLALHLGAQTPGLRAVAALSPGFNYFRLTIDGVISSYGQRPLFLAASENDPYSADTVRQLAEEAGSRATLLVFPAAGHGTDMFGATDQLAPALLGFLHTSLARPGG
jgi:dienelactone hydrolase